MMVVASYALWTRKKLNFVMQQNFYFFHSKREWTKKFSSSHSITSSSTFFAIEICSQFYFKRTATNQMDFTIKTNFFHLSTWTFHFTWCNSWIFSTVSCGMHDNWLQRQCEWHVHHLISGNGLFFQAEIFWKNL